MIQFFLSNILAVDMAMHLAEPPLDDSIHTQGQAELERRQPASLLPAMTWYAHRVTVGGHQCIITMEATTRYAMVFCGMRAADFECFPSLFQERLWREIFGVCEGIPEGDMNQLSAIVLNICEQQCYQAGHDRSVTAHIKQVAGQLEFMYHNGEALPVDRQAAFNFGVGINKTVRKRRGEKDYFLPEEAFQDLCGELISDNFIATTAKNIDSSNKSREQHKHLKSVPTNYGRSRRDNNIIHVDFKNKR